MNRFAIALGAQMAPLAVAAAAVGIFVLTTAACNDNAPIYITPQEALEVGIPGAEPNTTIVRAASQLILPVRPENSFEADNRQDLADRLGVDVPQISIDDLSVSIEVTVKNLSDEDGTAFVGLNGGNEQFAYDPLNFAVEAEEDEEPPALAGELRMEVDAGATVSGVLREDEIRQAAFDLEQISRGGVNPYAAILTYNNDFDNLTDVASGNAIPREAIAHLVQYDMVFRANRHMVMEYTVRVRDYADVVHDLLLDAPMGELLRVMPEVFQPPPEEEMQ